VCRTWHCIALHGIRLLARLAACWTWHLTDLVSPLFALSGHGIIWYSGCRTIVRKAQAEEETKPVTPDG